MRFLQILPNINTRFVWQIFILNLLILYKFKSIFARANVKEIQLPTVTFVARTLWKITTATLVASRIKSAINISAFVKGAHELRFIKRCIAAIKLRGWKHTLTLSPAYLFQTTAMHRDLGRQGVWGISPRDLSTSFFTSSSLAVYGRSCSEATRMQLRPSYRGVRRHPAACMHGIKR